MGLEKILEEIENLKKLYVEIAFASIGEGNLLCEYDKSDIEAAKIQALSEVAAIIRKHMNDRDSSDDLTGRQALLDDFRNTITEQSSTLDWLNMIARQKVILVNGGKDINVPAKDNDGWIPVEERLPTEEERIGGYDRGIPWSRRLEVAYMTDTVEYTFGYYDGFKFYDKRHRKIKNVIAWKIHEPYQPEKGAE